MAEAAKIVLEEGTVPTTPAANKWAVYTKADGLYVVDDAGTETGPMGSGSSGGGSNLAVAAKTANYTATSSDYLLLVDATAGAVTITLPAASSSSGMVLIVKKTDSGANAVTVDANGAETIDGVTTVGLTTQYDSVKIQCDGTEWWIH